MTSYVTDRWGGSDHDPTDARLREVLAQFDVDDIEHTDAWVEHDSGWTLTYQRNGVLVWSNEEDELPRVHLSDVPRDRVLELWRMLLQGRIDEIAAEPWEPGEGAPPISDSELAHATAQARADDRAFARQFLEKLGPERPDEPCREIGCQRGAVRLSVLCRVHHFESVWHKPYPFADEVWGVERPRESPLSTADPWKGWWKGPNILADEELAKLRAAIEESVLIVEHWHYYGASNPDRMFFEVFDLLEQYLREKTRPGDAIYVWSWASSGSTPLTHGKIPNAAGLVPEGGSY